MIRFDDFIPGNVLGVHRETLDGEWFGQWREVLGASPPTPGGLAMAFAMRSYLTILPERPGGNIHARQRLRLHGRIAPGDTIEATLACTGRELKNGRRRVALKVQATREGAPLFEAEMTIYWAA
jgi:acyl dehydratase